MKSWPDPLAKFCTELNRYIEDDFFETIKPLNYIRLWKKFFFSLTALKSRISDYYIITVSVLVSFESWTLAVVDVLLVVVVVLLKRLYLDLILRRQIDLHENRHILQFYYYEDISTRNDKYCCVIELRYQKKQPS